MVNLLTTHELCSEAATGLLGEETGKGSNPRQDWLQ